ncbi:hypothetical protein [Chryseobacterium sp. NKUCC03_KSP]|uniref:hypothetical protein n=1 Tax=Chryseobacterium sp. NKUCC03_KSP TaxID=2842125 RepID=UPI001C5BFAD5|nr:hypothetical protein [Chryseobacterium sp. NKUCC03_KSP]MBW3524685.1 hypothetical protein [Chryseobacterium sp. NKUCC03_KSP]
MSWEREPLFTKSKLFFEKAFDEDRESPFFGLWCAMGLELLVRSAVANISPCLLADPDPTHQNLLHALNLGTSQNKKSIIITHVISLSQTLIPDFTKDHATIASAIIARRNEELHTGSAAFEEYKTSQWIAGFYGCCKILSESQNETLKSLFGDEIEKEADLILNETEEKVVGKTQNLIAAHKKVFENKSPEDQQALKEEAVKNGDKLSHAGHHRVNCPACTSVATVVGEPYGKEFINHLDDEIVVRRSILPTKFQCPACELKLNGYSALTAAKLQDHYTRRITYSPEDYYDMISKFDYDAIGDIYNEYERFENEYNNE